MTDSASTQVSLNLSANLNVSLSKDSFWEPSGDPCRDKEAEFWSQSRFLTSHKSQIQSQTPIGLMGPWNTVQPVASGKERVRELNWGPVKKAKCWRIDAFELWCWRRLLRAPWTGRRSNQSILKEISYWKDWCWSWNSIALATWCEELTHLKRHCCWERLRAGGEGANRGWDIWLASLTQWTWVWVNSGIWWLTGRPGLL